MLRAISALAELNSIEHSRTPSGITLAVLSPL
jgi:hypothetical protein